MKEQWSDCGEMPELENEKVTAPKSSQPWTLAEIVQLKADVPFHSNWWNWLCDKLDSAWGIGLFLFAISTIAFGPWVFEVWLGIGKNAALNVAFMVFYGVVIGFIMASTLANKFKARPPTWRQTSLGDFYNARGEVAAIPEFQSLLTTLLEYVPPGMPAWMPYEIEWCDKDSIIIVWRLRYSRITIGVPPTETTKLKYEDKVPMAVFDIKKMRVLPPPGDPGRGTIILG